MKRNKCTSVKAHEKLDAFTEHVLAQMGAEGAVIRRKLQLYYRRRKQPLYTAARKEMQ